MPAYDLRYDPPAPIALVTLKNPATNSSLPDIPMLLDTGADLTLIPHYVVEQLGLQLDSTVGIDLVAFDGSRSVSAIVELHLTFQSLTFRGKYALTASRMGVIGRDILNFITLTLKGKDLVWEVNKN